MLLFDAPAPSRDAARLGVKSLAFDLVVLVLAAVLIVASVWTVAGNEPANGRDPSASKGVEEARPYGPAHLSRAW